MSDFRFDDPADPGDDDAILADWVAELAERLEAGEPVDLDALARRFPEQAAELKRVLPTIRRMASFGQAVARDQSAQRPARGAGAGAAATLGTLGDFRLLREVGRGGMGVVYEAEQISLRRQVALKILPLAAALDPRHHQRFLLEARASACLHHTHIVPVYAVGSERGVPYYAMQFIDGCTLAQVLGQLRKAGRSPGTAASPARTALLTASVATPVRADAVADPLALPAPPLSSLGTSNRDRTYIRAVADRGRQVAEALDHAHSRGILHRDIKPANLMLDVQGHLWITDFGLAQIQGDSRLTMTGDIIGTLRYMSPEQALSKRVVVDGRTDIYSLGATLYELLTLRPVFDGADRTEILRKIAQDEPQAVRKRNPAVPRDLETIVHKTLAKEPADRYATARDLADDLGRFLGSQSIAARPPGQLERLGKWGRRNRAVVLPGLLSAVLVMSATAGGLAWSNRWLRSHGEALRLERDHAAEISRELAAQRDLAEERRQVADRHLYAFRVRRASEALRARQFDAAQEILRSSRPAAREGDPREFAWHYLWRESRREVEVISDRTDQVHTVALSPDGRTAAIGERDGTIRLRDAATGALRATFHARLGPIVTLAFSPDGRRLASGNFPDHDHVGRGLGELALWDTATGERLCRLPGFEHRWTGELGFHASGDFLWERSGSDGRAHIGLWAIESGADGLHPRLLRRRRADHRLVLSADGRRAVGYEEDDRVLVVVKADSGVELRRLPREPHGYQTAGLSHDGRLVATVARHTPAGPFALTVRDVDSGQVLVDRLPTPAGHPLDEIAFSRDDRSLLIRNPVGAIGHYDFRTKAMWTVDPDPEDGGSSTSEAGIVSAARAVCMSYRGDRTGSRPVRLYDQATGALRASFPGRPEVSRHFLETPGRGSLLLLAGSQAVIWHYEPRAQPQPAGHTDEAWAVAFSEDGRLLASGSDDTDDPQTIKVWDPTTARLVAGWKAHAATTSALAFQPGGSTIASAALASTANLRLWDASTGALLATLDGHTDRVRTVAFRPDGRTLASAGSDRTIRLWDVASRRCVRVLAGHSDMVCRVAFSPDGRTLASASNDLTVRLWNPDLPEPFWHRKGGAKINAVAFSPDSRTLAWADEYGVIHRWDLAKRQALAPIHSTSYEELRCLAFSPDSRTLAAGGKSGKVHLWEPLLGQELLTLDGRPAQVNALAFSPDGQSLAACWHDGAVRLFRAASK